MTVHLPILILVGVTSLPDCDETERVGCKSPRNCTSAMMTVRPPRVMFAVPVMAERRETLLPESWYISEYYLKQRLVFCRIVKAFHVGCRVILLIWRHLEATYGLDVFAFGRGFPCCWSRHFSGACVNSSEGD